ncbi:MAG TPA: MerR family transcriptional regulator [Ktedonobacteraceae bacterium]|jgi:DNA-binding transcriptional MerR regulator
MRELLQIGEVARLVGVSAKTIRYYQEIGLLDEPERATSGYRLYTAHHLLRLQRIRRLRSLGLSLERIRAILSDAAEDSKSTLRAALHSLVEELSAQILELEERRTLLQTLLEPRILSLPKRALISFIHPQSKLNSPRGSRNKAARHWPGASILTRCLAHFTGRMRIAKPSRALSSILSIKRSTIISFSRWKSALPVWPIFPQTLLKWLSWPKSMPVVQNC